MVTSLRGIVGGAFVQIKEVDGTYYLMANGLEFAYGPNPEKLSEWAFASGAQEVRHDYDLVKREADRNR